MKKFTLFSKLMMIILLSSVCIFHAKAQMLQYGSYYTYTYYIPARGNYAYGYSKTIYLNDQLGQDPYTITKLGWYVRYRYGGSNPVENNSLWLKEVDFNTWSSAYPIGDAADLVADGWTQVWGGDVNLSAGQWNVIDLDTQFGYTGQYNLALYWLNMDGNQSGNQYWYFDQSYTDYFYQSGYYYSNSSPPTFGYSTSYVPMLQVYFTIPPGEIYGMVTDTDTGDPISGAKVSAEGEWDSGYSYTNSDGEYTFMVTGGNYDVTCDKPGYQPVTEYDVYIPPEGMAELDFGLGEALTPPSGVVAELREVDLEVVDITWGIPNGFYEIIYDDGEAENYTAWLTEGSYHAVKFTPVQYPVTLHGGSINIGDGTYPPGGDPVQDFEIIVFDDDGEDGMPGTVLFNVEVEPQGTGWVAFDLSRDPQIVLNEGEFYIAHKQLGNWPDCAPTAIDESDPDFRSYTKYLEEMWLPFTGGDFMIRVVVSGPGGAGGTLTASGMEYIPQTRHQDEMRFANSPMTGGGYIGEALYVPREGGELSRLFSHYEVYRMNEGDEGNPSLWTLLAGFVPTNEYTDNAWESLENGGYRWGVTAVYDGGTSDPAISNLLGKNWESDVTVNVELSSGDSPEGTSVSLVNQDGLPIHTYTALLDETGTVTFEDVWHGTYDFEVFKFGYETYFEVLDIMGPMTKDVYLLENTLPPIGLTVDPLTLWATWLAPEVDLDMLYEDFSSGSFATNGWTFEPSQGNWSVYTFAGYPAPCARFYWSPSLSNYTHSLTSKELNSFGVPSVMLEYTIYLNNYSTSTEEMIDVELWNGTEWISLAHYTNQSGTFGPLDEQWDIGAVIGPTNMFKIRFNANGDDSFNINWWYLDNIAVYGVARDGEIVNLLGDDSRGVLGYNVYLDGGVAGFATQTQFRYPEAIINWGQEYVSAVEAVYASGVSDKIFYTWTSIYLPPPTNLAGEDVGHAAYLTWEAPGGGGGGYFWDFEDEGIPEGFEVTDARWSCPGDSYLNFSGSGQGSNGSVYYADEEPWGDGVIEAKVHKVSGNGDYAHGLFIRATGFLDVGTFSGYRINVTQNGSYSVIKYTNSSYTFIQSWTSSGFLNTGFGNDNIISVACQGSSFELYFNGNFVFAWSDASFPTGVFNMIAYDISSDVVNFDYYTWMELPPESIVKPVNGEKKIEENTQTFSGTPDYCEGSVVNDPVPLRSPIIEGAGYRGEYGEILAYNLYRDGGFIGSVPGDVYEYTDEGLLAGWYEYTVTAEYDDPTAGESMEEGPIEVYINGEGTFTGTVSELGEQFIPIVGALVTATGDMGVFTAVTGAGGVYVMPDVTEGTYTLTAEAATYETGIVEGVFLGDEQTVTVNFDLLEFPYPVIGVNATRDNMDTEVFVNWYEYSDFILITYNDNIADNVTAWNEEGNLWALRFTPPGYPVQVFAAEINIYDGSWPSGNSLVPFEVAIFKDNGPGGLPGEMLASKMYTPFDYGWQFVDFEMDNIMIYEGDFYVAMKQGGDYPDCAPIAIDESNPVYRSYQRDAVNNEPWRNSDFADFMMNAFIYTEADGPMTLTYQEGIENVEIESLSGKPVSLKPGNVQPGTYETGMAQYIPKGEGSSREIEGYEVYLVNEGDETSPDLWLFKDEVTETNYLDTDWADYDKGYYRYAVIASYTYNKSAPAFSQLVPKGFDHMVTINVKTNTGESPEGALVVLVNRDGDPTHTYTETAPEDGTVIFYQVWEGLYDLFVTKDYYDPYDLQGFGIFNDITLNVTINETFLPPQALFVDNMTGVATWLPPILEYTTIWEEGFEGGAIPAGWTQEFLVQQVPWQVGTGGPIGIPEFPHSGEFNATFSGSSATTRLVTPELNLAGEILPQLVFWHSQPATAAGGQDELKVFYKASASGTWRVMASYFQDIPGWKQEVIQLPNPSGTYYIAFQGYVPQVGVGNGIALDDVSIQVALDPLADNLEGRVLEGYNVFLDGEFLTFTTELTYTYTDLVIGQLYVAGVNAQYTGGTSINIEFPFIYYTCDYFAPPENFQGAVNEPDMEVVLTWSPPGGQPILIEYVWDDGSYENGWTINPGYEVWMGNQFPVAGNFGEIILFKIWFYTNAGGQANELTVDVFDADGELLGTSDPFACTPETWNIIAAPNIPYNEFFYALIHYDMETSQSHWCGYDENGPFSQDDYGTYYDGTAFQSFSSAAGTVPGVFMLRVTAQVGADGDIVEFGPQGIAKENPGGTGLVPETLAFSGISGVALGDDEPGINTRQTFELLGYNVWRNGDKLTAEPLSLATYQYTDQVSPGGVYEYNVTAVYDYGQSCPIDPPFIATLGADLQPPTDLTAQLLRGDDVLLTWNAPGAPTGEWIQWCDDENTGGLGLSGGGDWYVAAYWDQTDLLPYDGQYLTKMAFVPADIGEEPCQTGFVVKVWTGDQAATEVISHEVTNPLFNEWNTITFETALMIDATQQLWVGYMLVGQLPTPAEYPAGLDAGPHQADGKGDQLSFDGVTWQSLYDAAGGGIDRNFTIKAYVSTEAANYAPVTPLEKSVANNNGGTFEALDKQGTTEFIDNSNSRQALLGYNLWRNGQNFTFVPEPDTFFVDMGLVPNTYEYYVSAVYDEGESFPDGPAMIEILAKGGITGLVYDGMTGTVIPNAVITTEPGGYTTTSGFDGRYTFEDLPIGEYALTCVPGGEFSPKTIYGVDVVYDEFTVVDFAVYTPDVMALPFYEPWDAGSFDDQFWTFDPEPGNWEINTSAGNPAPTAEFNWAPSWTNYSFAMVSPFIDATTAANNVTLKFDLYLSDFGSTGLEKITVDVWDGAEWMMVDEIANTASIDWTTYMYDITDYALGELTKVRFVASGDDSFEINYWYVDNIMVYELVMATLQGTVSVAATGNPIEDAMILVEGYDPVYTDANGFYTIDVEEGTYDVMCEAEGFNTVEAEDVFITGVLEWNVEMTAPTMTVDPLTLNETLYEGETSTQYLTVYNDGDGMLHWSASIATLNANASENIELVTADREDLETLNPVQEWSPRTTEVLNANTDDMWDVQFVYDVTTASGGTLSQAGVEFDGEYFYTTIWNTGSILKFEKDGTYIGTYTITGASNIRDLAYDGEYLYGGAASTMIYAIDPSDFSVVDQFSSPVNVRAIAYDDIYDGFWACDWETDLYLVGRDGSTIDVIINPGVASVYGLAFDDITGDPSLWVFSQAIGGCDFIQVDIASGSTTGVTRDVLADIPAAGTPIAGGAFMTKDYEQGIVTLGGLIQADFNLIFGYELATYDMWLIIEPTSGNIAGGDFAEVEVMFNAMDIEPGGYDAEITFSSDPDVGDQVVDVHLDVLVGIDDVFSAEMINMYPNPASDFVNFEVPSSVREVNILNYMGQVVYEMNVVDMKKFQINTSAFSAGSYTVEFITDTEEVAVKKLIIIE
jgi:hypothetical protein